MMNAAVFLVAALDFLPIRVNELPGRALQTDLILFGKVEKDMWILRDGLQGLCQAAQVGVRNQRAVFGFHGANLAREAASPQALEAIAPDRRFGYKRGLKKIHPMPLRTTITREELAQLTVRRYEGPVHLAATVHDLEKARNEFRHEAVVGLDTETRPAFRKGEVHRPSLAQVATSRSVYLFPLQKLDCAPVLTELLEDEKIVKAGIGLRDDFSKFRMCFPFEEKNAVELSTIAKRHGVEQPSARSLTGLFLGFRITKGQSTSNWGRVHLTPNQILYAATDAWVCRELYLRFQEYRLLDG